MQSEEQLLSPVVFHCRGPDCSGPRHFSSREEILISKCESGLLHCYGSVVGWKPPQNLPVSCRHLNSLTKSGTSGVPSGLCTVSGKASLAMDPPRGSFRAGHMIQGKPCDTSKARVRSAAHPFFSRSSTSMALCICGVPSRSVPFFAVKSASAVWHTGVVKASGV